MWSGRRAPPAPRTPDDRAYEAIRIRPEDPSAWAEVAEACERAGQFAAALACLEQARRHAPPHDGAQQESLQARRAFVAATLGRDRTEAILQSEGNLDRLLTELRREAVGRYLDRLLRQKPPAERGGEDARRLAGKHLDQARRVRTKHWEEACATFLEALRICPALGCDAALRHVELLEQERREDAAEEYLARLAEATNEFVVLQRLTQFYRSRMGAGVAASGEVARVRRERLHRVLEWIATAYPSYRQPLAERGLLLMDQGRVAEAAAIRDRLLQDPATVVEAMPLDTLVRLHERSHPAALEESSRLVGRATRFGITEEQATLDYEEALRRNPHDMRAAIGLVDHFTRLGLFPEALQLATAAFAQDPEAVEVAAMLHRAWRAAGLVRKALDAALYFLGRWPCAAAWENVAATLEALNEDPDDRLWAQAARARSDSGLIRSDHAEMAERLLAHARTITPEDVVR